jgi:hypothetical protein
MPRITEALTLGENAEDVATMIELLAEARADKRGTPVEEEVNNAAKIICIILDPVKPPTYRKQSVAARREFVGIANDLYVQRAFRAALEPVALRADVRTVVSFGRFVRTSERQSRPDRARELIDNVASAYDIDAEKLHRLFQAMNRVLQRRLELRPADAQRLLRAVFARCVEERERIVNPHGWLLDTTFALGEDARTRQITAAAPTLVDLLRAENDDEEQSLGLEFE